jgi:hypothetical protein
MSFRNLKHEELVKAVKYFEVPGAGEDNTRLELIAALEEADVSWSNYKKFVADDAGDPTHEVERQGTEEQPFAEPAAQAVEFSPTVLVKMERKNPTYDILGRRFTQKHPYQVMTEAEAQELIDVAETEGGGFRIANPSEAKSYFG